MPAKKSSSPKASKSTGKETTFRFFAPEAFSIAVGGTFNNWSHDKHMMKKEKTGFWTIAIPLKPGRYEYLFHVNGNHWEPDQEPGERVANDFGTVNCVKYVK